MGAIQTNRPIHCLPFLLTSLGIASFTPGCKMYLIKSINERVPHLWVLSFTKGWHIGSPRWFLRPWWTSLQGSGLSPESWYINRENDHSWARKKSKHNTAVFEVHLHMTPTCLIKDRFGLDDSSRLSVAYTPSGGRFHNGGLFLHLSYNQSHLLRRRNLLLGNLTTVWNLRF